MIKLIGFCVILALIFLLLRMFKTGGLATRVCPHCGQQSPAIGAYCPICGKRIV
jgi:predicted amidophosphoribosyltransferase